MEFYACILIQSKTKIFIFISFIQWKLCIPCICLCVLNVLMHLFLYAHIKKNQEYQK